MIKSTSTLRGEKLKDKEVRVTWGEGKWSVEKESQRRWLIMHARCREEERLGGGSPASLGWATQG